MRLTFPRFTALALAMAMALSTAAREFQAVFASGGTAVTKYGVDTTARLEAGFAAEEVEVAAGQAETRRRQAQVDPANAKPARE